MQNILGVEKRVWMATTTTDAVAKKKETEQKERNESKSNKQTKQNKRKIGKKEKKKKKKKGRQTDGQRHEQTDRESQTDRQAASQTDRDRDRQNACQAASLSDLSIQTADLTHLRQSLAGIPVVGCLLNVPVGVTVSFFFGTVSRATLGRLLRDGAERAWAFPSATMPSWAETETET